jgi:hypothetical protein
LTDEGEEPLFGSHQPRIPALTLTLTLTLTRKGERGAIE